MLAGRKLLLADDSVTIQKVIELTFADEGVRVVAFNNGQDAIDKLEEIAPDIVLADALMPAKTGYEVCEYVKQNEKLKHIPVMLLVGSFEPFDEAEARRVGADDILTKPFQSIRRLIDRVGSLVSGPPAEKEVPTAELPNKAEDESTEEEYRLNTEELAITTADTMPLPEELRETVEFPQPVIEKQTELGEDTMEIGTTEVSQAADEESADVLLDLGEFEPAHAAASEEFVLDLDTDFDNAVVDDVTPAEPMRAFVEPEVTETVASGVPANGFSYQPEVQVTAYSKTEEIAYEDQVHEIADEPQPVGSYETEPSYQAYETMQSYEISEPAPANVDVQPAVPSGTAITPESLSQEVIDAIARRVVEMMSDKVVREITWEVVPDLAELLIKKQLEDKESQPK